MGEKIKNYYFRRSPLGKFLWYCSLFALLIVVGLTMCELLVRNKTVNPHKFRHERLKANSSDIKTLILGNSLTYLGIMPARFGDSTFNLAVGAQNFKYDNLLLRHYPFENLETVIIQVSYTSFTDQEIEDSEGWYYASNYKIYMDINEHSDISRYNFEMALFPNFLAKLRSVFKPKILSCDSLGFGLDLPYENRRRDLDYVSKELAKFNTAPDLSQTNIQVGYLEKIIDYCESRHIRLVMISPPHWHTYVENLNTSQLRNMETIVDSISRTREVEYLDFMNDCRFVGDDFHDGLHLNSKGAAKFTKILKDTLNA